MRTADYLKTAAAQLRQAVMAAKLEMDELRKTIADHDASRSRRINELKNEERNHLTSAFETDSDESRATAVQRAKMMRDEESRIEDDFNRHKQEIDQALAARQRNIDRFNRMAQDLENQAGQF